MSSLKDEKNDLILSVVSVWEIQVKIQLGRLKLSQSLTELIESQQQNNDLQILPIGLSHVLALDALPFHHKDPFDRLLIAQSIVENLTIVTADEKLSVYSAKLLQ